MGGFALGVSLAWNSNCGYKMSNLADAAIIEIGLVGIILNIGVCFGVLCAPCMIHFCSYTGTMFMTIPLFLFGWAFICFASKVASTNSLLLSNLLLSLQKIFFSSVKSFVINTWSMIFQFIEQNNFARRNTD